MSLRAVKSPLAPKMTMEQGSGALRSEPMWQGGESSSEIGLFTGQPWRNRRLNSTLLVLEFRLQPVFAETIPQRGIKLQRARGIVPGIVLNSRTRTRRKTRTDPISISRVFCLGTAFAKPFFTRFHGTFFAKFRCA